MAKVLYIKANPKVDGLSKSIQVANEFIKSYMEINPMDEVIELDLYQEDINYLSSSDLDDLKQIGNTDLSAHPIFKYAYQFLEADKYVIAAPFWNLSFPAILKAYIDYISISGITFKYGPNGPSGMCSGKALHIVSRGGHYMEGPSNDFEMGDRYLRALFGFLGINDFYTIAIEGVDIVGSEVDEIMNSSIVKSKKLALKF